MAANRTVMVQIPAADYPMFSTFVSRMGWKIKLKKEPATASYAQQVSPSGDEWWNLPENVSIVQEGSRQLQEGQGVELSSDDIRARLGL